MKGFAAGACLLGAVALGGCGSGLQAVGTGGTGAPAKSVVVVQGPITGFGSLHVNGQRIDETGARVTINGEPDRAMNELALGMVVEVRAVEHEPGATPAAQTIVAAALAIGTVESADAAGSVRVAGQVVRLSPSTALQGASAAAMLQVGDRVTVYGLRDPLSSAIEATRVEVAAPQTAAMPTRVVGTVSGLAGTRFFLAGQLVDAASATLLNLPAGLADGQFVEVQGPAFAAGGILVAARVDGRARLELAEGALVAVEDFVTDFAGVHSFRVLGQAVDASAATIEGGAIGNGARVDVLGRVQAGRLMAGRVVVRSAASQPAPDPVVAVEGVVSDFVSQSSLRIRDQVVDASQATFAGGTAAELANGRTARATGVQRGAVLLAALVELLARSEPEGTPLAVSGTVTDFVSPASFRVNGQAVATNVATTFASGTASTLANGRLVDVEGRVQAGVLLATQVAFREAQPPASSPQPARLSGFITDFVSPQGFRVNNQPVVATSATVFEDGTAASLANGREVTVEGTLLGGIVTATRIEFENRDAGGSGEGAEVEGAITSYTSVASFVVDGQLIDASAATFLNGSPARLAVGRKVHVKGAVSAGVLRAATISMEL